MKIGILGSGSVGKALAEGLLKSGHEVKLSTRDSYKLTDWLAGPGAGASVGTTREAAEFGEINFLCVKGTEVESALELAGSFLGGKILVDVTNPLLFEEEGRPPKMSVGYPESNGKRVQELVPDAKVVKAFNTVPAAYMANPRLSDGRPDLFIAGHKDGTGQVKKIAEGWGWNVIDIGGIEQSYLLEALAMLWIRYGYISNRWTHAFKLLVK